MRSMRDPTAKKTAFDGWGRLSRHRVMHLLLNGCDLQRLLVSANQRRIDLRKSGGLELLPGLDFFARRLAHLAENGESLCGGGSVPAFDDVQRHPQTAVCTGQ